MNERSRCDECLASHLDGGTCEEKFHTLLGWEHERETLRAQHHLLVLTYHLQHPSLYSPDGLTYARRLLADFLVGLTPTAARARGRAVLASDKRGWNVKATGSVHGSYAARPQWPVTIADVIASGKDEAAEQVQRWARTTQTALDRMEAQN